MTRSLIVGAILGAGLVSGGLLMQSGAWREAGAATASAHLLEQVMDRVRNDFIDTLSTDELYQRAASGLVKEIDDPYSALLTPERLRRIREATAGRYPGIGVELDIRDGFVTVVAPLAGTPADSAGIRPGDRILSVDGEPVRALAMEEVQRVLRGPAGTSVRLAIERGDEHPTVTLTRREIRVHPVQRAQLLQGGVGYVTLASFSDRAASEVRRAVDSLRASGARSLVLDVRENPGGLLEQGVAVADLFLDPRQTIASTRGRTADADRSFVDDTPQRWPAMPVVVLVDSGTASAAEIVAGALQDNERAVLVGSRTYGKGSAQQLFPLADGRALKLTIARWFTPGGRTIARDSTSGAITPDVTVATEATGADAVLTRALQLLAGAPSPAALRARVRR